MNESIEHVDGALFQRYLDGELDESQRGPLEAHVSGCVRCAEALEAWKVVFEELRHIPELKPSPHFREVVLAEIPAGTPASARPSGHTRWLRWPLIPAFRGHPAPARLQDFLDGTLAPRAARSLEGHLSECDSCRKELMSWRQLHASLGSIPSLAAPEGFSARVMEGLLARRAETAVTPAAAHVPSRLERFLPSTTRGRAVAAALLLAPAIGPLVLLGILLRNPVLDPAQLLAFTTTSAGNLLRSGLTWILQEGARNPTLGGILAWLGSPASSSAVILPGLVVIWAAVLGAGWILYRQLLTPPSTTDAHAHASP